MQGLDVYSLNYVYVAYIIGAVEIYYELASRSSSVGLSLAPARYDNPYFNR